MKITAEFLLKNGACEDQVALVRQHWPHGAPVTVPTLRKAMRLGLDVDWLTRFLLAPALAEYRKVTAPAWAEYVKARAPAWAEYRKVTAQALAPLLREAIASIEGDET